MTQDQGEQSSMDVAESENIGSAAAGERLKKTRLALGLSVSDVSTRLKLGKGKIESFECGDVASVATPVFVAGYLRAYARLLELPEDEVLADFGVLSAMQPSLGEAASEAPVFESTLLENVGSPSEGAIFTKLSSPEKASWNSVSLLVSIVLSVLVIAAVYFALLDGESTDGVKIVPAISSEPETTPRLSGEDSAGIAEKVPATESSAVQTSPVVHEAPAIVTAPVSTEDAEPASANETEQKDTAVETFNQSELALVFNGDSWAEVTDARGEKLVYRLAKAGMSRTVTGVAPFTVQLGYVPGVEIFFNGEPYDLSRFSGRRSAQFNVGTASDSIADR